MSALGSSVRVRRRVPAAPLPTLRGTRRQRRGAGPRRATARTRVWRPPTFECQAQPFVVQPFEFQLPYEAFALRADYEDLPNLPGLLRNVSMMLLYFILYMLDCEDLPSLPALLRNVSDGRLAALYFLLFTLNWIPYALLSR